MYKAQQAKSKTPKRGIKSRTRKIKDRKLFIDIDNIINIDEDGTKGHNRSMTPNALRNSMFDNRSNKSNRTTFLTSKYENTSVVDNSGVYEFLERQYKVHWEKERVSRLKQTGYTYRKWDFVDSPELLPEEHRSKSKRSKTPKIRKIKVVSN